MSTETKIRDLFDKGATAEEVADETKLRVRTVQTYFHMFSKESKPKKVNKGANTVNENMKKVMEMTDKGASVKEIAKKLGISENTVYSYRSEVRSKQNDVKAGDKPNQVNGESSQAYEKLKLKYNSLEKDNADLEQENTELKERNDSINIELIELEGKYKEMSEKISGSLSTNNEEIAALQAMISELTKEKEFLLKETSDLRLKNADLIDEAREDLHAIHSKYKTEKAKHETLFKYVNLSSEVS